MPLPFLRRSPVATTVAPTVEPPINSPIAAPRPVPPVAARTGSVAVHPPVTPSQLIPGVSPNQLQDMEVDLAYLDYDRDQLRGVVHSFVYYLREVTGLVLPEEVALVRTAELVLDNSYRLDGQTLSARARSGATGYMRAIRLEVPPAAPARASTGTNG